MITMLLTITENGHDFLMYLFEATSAFGTVGLSMGLTPELSNIGRLSDYFYNVCRKIRSFNHCICHFKKAKTRFFPSSKRKYHDWLIRNAILSFNNWECMEMSITTICCYWFRKIWNKCSSKIT